MIQKAKPYLRRFFALFLAACLMVGYVPTDALAASPDTATETIAETVTDETSADDNAPAEEPNTQKPDTSASAETPPQGNGVEGEKPDSSQQSSAENAENTEQSSNNTANSSEQTPAAPEKTTAPAGTASNSSVIGAPAPDDYDDENFKEMTPEQEAELKASLEAAGIDTSNLDLRSLTPEDIQKLLNDPSYDINATAEGPGGGWKDYSGQACIRATNGRVPGIGASTDGALTYHTWNPNGNPTRNDFATCLQSDRVWRSGDNLWNWAEVNADGWADESPTSAWTSIDYETRANLVLLAHYGLGGGVSKFSGSDGSVYAAMQLVAWQWINGASNYTSHYSSHVQELADELTGYVYNNPDNIDASQSTVYLIWPNAQTKFNNRYVWGQSLMKPATLVYAGPTTGILSLRKVSANDAVTNGNFYYSLSGAAYGVYSNPGCTNLVATLTTDGSGNASAELELGTYYIKEISASTGYQLDTTVYTVDLDGDKTLTVKENPRTANINLNKTSQNPDMTNGNNCYSLSGAVYGVYSDAACNNLVTTMTTDGSGNASTNLYLNTYYVKEISASKGYQLDPTVYTVNLSNDTNLGVKENPKNDPVGIRVTKIAEGVSGNIPSLAGTQFTVKYYAGQYTADNLPGSATRTWVIEAKQVGSSYVAVLEDDYKVSGDSFYTDVINGVVVIPIGTITVQETKPATGYTTEGAIVTSAGQTVTENNGIVVLNITENVNGAALNYGNVYTKTDKVIRGGIEVQKRDRETNGTTPLGGGSFAGITFTIVNNNDYSVEVNGQSRAKGEVVATLTTDANGYAATAPDALPYGSYIVTETALPENSGYRLTAAPVTVFVAENGVLVHTDFTNDLIRSELRFVKVDGNTGEHLSNIPFRVTDKKTGESHIIVTDVNGIFDSSVYTNKQRDNANDAAVAPDGTVNEALLDSNSGVWFSGSLTQRPAVDGLNSFPYGTYVVEELLTSKNSDYTMISFEFTVYRDAEVLDIGTVDNNRGDAYFSTYLTDKDTNGKIASTSKNTTLVDEIEFGGLTVGREYTLDGKLYATDDLNTVIATASMTFTADVITGTKRLEFTFDSTGMEGKDIVAFVTLSKGNQNLFVSDDPANADETVHFAGIRTTAMGSNDEKEIVAGPKAVVVDKVSYYGLTPGVTYVLKGTLMNYETGEVARDSNGVAITAETSFKPTTGDGVVDVVFNFDASTMGGMNLVAFEQLTRNTAIVATHEDLQDAEQTVAVPKVGTTLKNEDGGKTAAADTTVTLIDTVTYSGVIVGKQYTVTGTLMDKATGKAVVDANGAVVTATKTFTAEAVEGTVDISFTFDSSVVAGNAVVAFEELSNGVRVIAEHKDINDEDQTVKIPHIRTTASDRDGNKEILADGSVVIQDTVSYDGLPVANADDTYTMTGTLMDKETGESVKDASGNPITASTSVHNTTESGTVILEFRVSDAAAVLEGKTVVVFEVITDKDGKEIAKHEDIEDKDQTVHFPGVKTTATDDAGSKELIASGKMTVVDVVKVTNVTPGNEYTIKGTLIDKATGETAVDAAGKPITSSVTFVPTTANGSIKLTFTFDGSNFEGKTLVAFEKLYDMDNRLVGNHENPDDKEQTVTVPKIRTTFVGENGLHVVKGGADALTLIDTVSYENLVPGKTYTLNGVLMGKNTGEKVICTVSGGDEEIIASTVFTPDTPNGTVDVMFTIPAPYASVDGSDGLSDMSLVAFETLVNADGKTVAAHEDIKDEGQTIYIVSIGTSLKDANNYKEFNATGKITVIDTVTYRNLIPGTKYTVKGTLMNKATGEAAVDASGSTITAETSFTPNTADGTINLPFTFNASNMEGVSLVAFEQLFSGEAEIADHKNLEDKDQTVTFPKVRTTAHSEAGDDEFLASNPIKLIDTVTYENLIPGNSYTLIGTVMDKDSRTLLGKINPLTVGGEVVTATVTFTPENANGTVDVVFEFNGEQLGNKSLVVFETLYDTESRVVGTHEDENDEKQDFTVPAISTSLKADNGLHLAKPNEEMTLTDTVTYKNLIVGKQYTAKGTLMDKATGKPVVDKDGKKVTAEKTFTPDTKDGSIELVFTFNSSDLAGESVVAFERVENRFGAVAIHEDLEDEEQTVHLPKLRTTAADANGEKEFNASGKLTIIDKVTYENLIPGTKYTVKGTLMDKDAGKAAVDASGKEITAEATFTPSTASGSVNLSFTFNASNMEGKSLVAFEKLFSGGAEIAGHEDFEDKDQTVTFPKVRTTAHSEKGDDEFLASNPIKLIDTVAYENLIPGKSYTLIGTVMDKDSRTLLGKIKPLTVGGEVVSATVTFTPENANGTVDVVFEFNGEQLGNKSPVVFETLYDAENRVVGTHEDENDEKQDFTVPVISTSLKADNGLHLAKPNEEMTLTDTVTYKNLVVGKQYTAKGTLMDKTTGKPVVGKDGKVITAEKTFTPDTKDGTIDLVFTFNASNLAGESVVAFEKVENRFGAVAVHEDLKDEEQTVHFPKVRTTAADANGEKEFNAAGKLTIIDKVTYENLIPGTKYTVKGTLMDKDAGKAAVDASGKEITAEATFTPATASGSVNLSFTFNASNMEGKSLVAFEKLFSSGAEIAGHEDFEDKEQTVTFPKVRTTAHSEKGDDEFLAADPIKLIDTVTYENLIPGKSYTLIGTIMDKGSRTLLGKIKPLTDNGEAIVSSVTFVPEEANGSVDVVFQFNGEALGNKSFVVFETLYDVNNRIVGSHEDENDKDQDFTVPKISTSLKDNNGLHVTKPSEEMTLTDTVTHKNLVVGKQYTAKGTLMNKSTGEPVVDKDGKEITAETTFTPAEKDGTVDLVFKFDASELAGESVVAFEKVANEFGVIAVHEDLEDEEQTVHCPAIKTTASDANGNKDFYAHDTVSVVDTIEYKNLAVGLRYTVEGTLMDKATGEAITDEKGEAITAKTSFTPKAPDGTVNITFRFKADDMEGKTLVAFEVLTTKNVKGEDTPVASHEDIEDEDQTVHFPKVHTTAVAENDEHLSMPNDPTKIVDRVYYDNLLVGETYEVVGTLMNKATGKPIKDNDKDVIESRVTFVAEKADGYIDIEFNINASEFLNNTLVAFEELYHDSRLVGTHKNMEDEDQSVHFPKIRTSAVFEDGTRVLKTQVDTEVVTIIDTVSYENLIPGKTYKVSGTLMNKEDEGVLRNAEGEIYIADAEFTPEAASGTVDVTFKVQIGDIIGKKVVVFESLMVNGKTIAEHKDINDNDQTVTTPYVTKAFKYDASTEKPLAGAYFSVTDQGPVDEKSTDKMLLDVQTVVSDEDGNIYFNALPGHEYAIKETKAPDGYTLDTETYFVTVDEKGNADVELRIANVRGGTVVIKKIDVITGDPLKGCEITVYRILEGGKREEVFKQQTDAKGLVYFHTDVPGEYVYKETVSIDGYYLNSDEQYFKIGEDGRISGELILANVPWGTVVLTKTDPKGTPLAGAQFNVYAEDNTLLGVAVTNEKGRIYFVSPGPGKYYFVETKAPRGYRINTEKHYFVVGADNSITGSTSLVNGLTGVKTGDNNNATLWLASGAGSMFAIAGIGYVIYANEKKRRKAQN